MNKRNCELSTLGRSLVGERSITKGATWRTNLTGGDIIVIHLHSDRSCMLSMILLFCQQPIKFKIETKNVWYFIIFIFCTFLHYIMHISIHIICIERILQSIHVISYIGWAALFKNIFTNENLIIYIAFSTRMEKHLFIQTKKK